MARVCPRTVRMLGTTWLVGGGCSGAMGAAMARDAPPSLQTVVSAMLRTRFEVALAGLDGSGKTSLSR
eukprot:164838-Prymnesium_polylepis.1